MSHMQPETRRTQAPAYITLGTRTYGPSVSGTSFISVSLRAALGIVNVRMRHQPHAQCQTQMHRWRSMMISQ